jgi:ABC-2 type transport system permease protein
VTIGLFVRFVRLRVRERMEYRGAYLLGVGAQILGWGADYAVIYLLLQRFGTLNGWTWEQVAFLFSLNLFTYAIGASFTFNPMTEVEDMVADGSFDTVLVRPLDPLLQLVARRYNVGYVAHIVISAGFLAWSAGRLGIDWGPAELTYLALAIVGAACLQAAALIAIGSLAFILVRTGEVFGLYYALKGFQSYPITLYHVAIQWLLTLAVPLAFVNFYPASFLLGKEGAVLPAAAGLAAPLVGAAALLGAYRLFRVGVDRYQGAGG